MLQWIIHFKKIKTKSRQEICQMNISVRIKLYVIKKTHDTFLTLNFMVHTIQRLAIKTKKKN